MTARLNATRRFLLRGIGGAAFVPLLRSTTAMAADAMITRPIPSSGEAMPVIGLGTWQVFDAGDDQRARAPLKEVLQRLVAAGGGGVGTPPGVGPGAGGFGGLGAAPGGRARAVFAPPLCGRGAE